MPIPDVLCGWGGAWVWRPEPPPDRGPPVQDAAIPSAELEPGNVSTEKLLFLFLVAFLVPLFHGSDKRNITFKTL